MYIKYTLYIKFIYYIFLEIRKVNLFFLRIFIIWIQIIGTYNCILKILNYYRYISYYADIRYLILYTNNILFYNI